MADKAMIVCLGANLDIDAAVAALVAEKSFRLGETVPSKFEGGDVPVYASFNDKRYVYLGIMRKATLDRAAKALAFESFDRLNDVVAIDPELGIDRPELYAPNGRFGPTAFNYVKTSVVKMVENRGSGKGVETRGAGAAFAAAAKAGHRPLRPTASPTMSVSRR